MPRRKPTRTTTVSPTRQHHDLPRFPGVHVDVDDEIPMSVSGLAAFLGERAVPAGQPIRFVHVMSAHAGGEIRGYVLTAGKLHLRLPCYTGVWPELDAAVAAAVGAEILPYETTGAGGMAYTIARTA